MDQSTKLFGALLGAFLLYITAKGELSAYWALLTTSAGPSSSAGSGEAPQTSGLPSLGSSINLSGE